MKHDSSNLISGAQQGLTVYGVFLCANQFKQRATKQRRRSFLEVAHMHEEFIYFLSKYSIKHKQKVTEIKISEIAYKIVFSFGTLC